MFGHLYIASQNRDLQNFFKIKKSALATLPHLTVHLLVKSATLWMFHAFPVCDTVSPFGGRGKKTAWKVWNAFPAVTDAFYPLANPPMLQAMIWLLWRDLSSTSMTRPVALVTSMRHGNIYFTRKPGTLKTSLLPKQRFISRQNEPCTRPVTSGPGTYAISGTRSIRLGMEAGERGMGAKLDATSASSDCMCWTFTRCGCKKSCCIPCRCAKAGLTCNALCLWGWVVGVVGWVVGGLLSRSAIIGRNSHHNGGGMIMHIKYIMGNVTFGPFH